MSCECESYTCIEAFINPCSEGVQLDIIPDYTGNMLGRVWFNGTVSTFEISVEEGEKIIVPIEQLNENYVHDLRVYNQGDLIACYKVKTYIDYESETFTPMPATVELPYVLIFQMGTPPDTPNSTYGTPVSVANGSTIQDDLLIGATLLDIENVTENLMPVTGMGINGFNSTTGTITLSDSYSDTFFKVMYKKSNS